MGTVEDLDVEMCHYGIYLWRWWNKILIRVAYVPLCDVLTYVHKPSALVLDIVNQMLAADGV